jgi:transposase
MRYSSIKYDRVTHLILDDVEGTELSLKEIAQKHEVSLSFVAGRLKAYGIKHGRKSGASLKPSQIQEIVTLSERGYPADELAEKFGVCIATVHRQRSLAGYEKPRVEKYTGYVHIKCRQLSAKNAMQTASFFGMHTASFVSEAIEHYINHLKS